MARLPTIRSFRIEEFTDQKSWIGRLLSPLNEFITSIVIALSNGLTFRDNLNCQLKTVQIQTDQFFTAGSFVATMNAENFVDADVNVGTNVVTIAAHGFQSGDRVELTTTGTLPGGLALNTVYYLVRLTANTIQFTTTFADAINVASIVDITSAAGGGTHTVRQYIQQSSYLGLYEKPKFQIEPLTLKTRPIGLVKFYCVDTSSNPTIPVEAVDVQWSIVGTQIQIDQVSGLEPAKIYNLTVMVSGG